MKDCAGSSAYGLIWQSLLRDNSAGWEEEIEAQAAALAAGRVVVVDWEQVKALPRMDEDEAKGYLAGLRLPFDPLFLEMVSPFTDDDTPRLLGVVLWDVDGVRLTPWFEFHADWPVEDRVAPLGRIWTNGGQWSFTHVDPNVKARYKAEGRVGKPEESGVSQLCWTATMHALHTLFFLESANVLLEDAPLTRQVRRAAKRQGSRIALTVKVRPPKRSRSRGGSRTFSHRFEVRGHYMHFPLGTRMADAAPEKTVELPDRGRCRRIWCPPHVKGPEDKPLIPKRRVLA